MNSLFISIIGFYSITAIQARALVNTHCEQNIFAIAYFKKGFVAVKNRGNILLTDDEND